MRNIKPIIKNVNGATFATIDTETNVKLAGGKKNPLQGKVIKKTIGSNVMLFQNKESSGYSNMVKRRLEQEGKDPSSFKLSPRTWGIRLPEMPVVEHKGNHYVEVIFLKPGKSHYEVDGVVTDPDDIPGLPVSKSEGNQGGLDNKVVIRTFKTNSITKININNDSFEGPFTYK